MPDLCENRRIKWLVGYPKSGTTWVRLFVNSLLSAFPNPLESPYTYVTDDSLPNWYQMICPRPVTKLDPVWLSYYRPAALANMLLNARSRDICLRTHWPRAKINRIDVHVPELSRGACVIVRDPRDVACSFAKYFHVSIDRAIEMMACETQCVPRDDEGMYHFLGSWSNHILSWTENNEDISYGVIRYEDMLNEPLQAFRNIVTCLCVANMSDERIEWAIKQTAFDKLKAREEQHGFQGRDPKDPFFRQGKAGGWRNTLTDEQVRSIEETHGEVMEQLGYEKELVTC